MADCIAFMFAMIDVGTRRTMTLSTTAVARTIFEMLVFSIVLTSEIVSETNKPRPFAGPGFLERHSQEGIDRHYLKSNMIQYAVRYRQLTVDRVKTIRSVSFNRGRLVPA